VTALQNVDSNICSDGLLRGISWEIQNVQVVPFVN
jgi:hypothetical protein